MFAADDLSKGLQDLEFASGNETFSWDSRDATRLRNPSSDQACLQAGHKRNAGVVTAVIAALHQPVFRARRRRK
jgi:hypothetical protein